MRWFRLTVLGLGLLGAALSSCAGPRRAMDQASAEVSAVATQGAATDLRARDQAVALAAELYARRCALALTALRAEGLDPAGLHRHPCTDPALGAAALASVPEVTASVIQVDASSQTSTVTVTDRLGKIHTATAR